MGTYGPDYDPKLDKNRLNNQLGKIYELMFDGQFRTLSEIASIVKAPESSVSAQLRHLRKDQFGGYIINKRRRGTPGRGLFEYQLREKKIKEKQLAFLTF